MQASLKQITEFYSVLTRSFGAYRRRIAALIILGFINGLLGGIGVSAVIPLFSVVTQNGAVGTDIISRSIHWLFTLFGIHYGIVSIVVFILALFAMKAAFFLLASYIDYHTVQLYQERTRLELFSGLLRSNWQYLLGQKLGHIETVMVKNVEKAAMLLEQIGLAFMTITTTIAYTIVAFTISPKITIVIFATAVLAAVFMRAFPRRVEKLSMRLEAYYRDVSHHINESMVAMKMIKTRAVEDAVIGRTRPVLREITHESVKIRMSSIIPSALLEPISVVLVMAVFAFTRHVSGFNIATLAALVYVIKQIFSYLMQLQAYLFAFREYVPYLRIIVSYQDAVRENSEPKQGDAAFIFHDTLEFRKVAFAYQDGKQVFNDLSFKIKKGQLVGVIGASGGGKTTLVDLLLRMFLPLAGGIYLDGVESREISLSEWRRHIGYVPQEVVLRNGTIAENIKFYDDSISDAAMKDAAKLANIFDFIESLPAKWETQVGERGVKLSGGQKQRIGIAMALARKPEIIVFDEATSALDNESEQLIKQAMENMRGKVTTLAVAHRISTIMDADRIIALGGGKVLEEGKPKDLLLRPDSYLSKMQHITHGEQHGSY